MRCLSAQRQLLAEEFERGRQIERRRMARDLHDQLGASLTEIGMLADNAAQPGAADDSQRARCRLIQQKVKDLVGDLDGLVWAADPRHDTLVSLVSYLCGFVEQYASGCGLQCRIDRALDLPPRSLTPETRRNLFLATQEAVHNAVRHAAATCLTLKIQAVDGHLRIVVRDNGRGFDLATAPIGNGLNNLRERLIALGGRCDVASQPQAGTTVTFLAPLPD